MYNSSLSLLLKKYYPLNLKYSSIQEIINENISATAWPEEVPIIKRNDIKPHFISHVIFSVTSDINADFPAKYARINLNWTEVPMLCFNEIDVPGSLRMCLRTLIVINCNEDFKPEFVYLDGAEGLRK